MPRHCREHRWIDITSPVDRHEKRKCSKCGLEQTDYGGDNWETTGFQGDGFFLRIEEQ